MFYNFLKMKVEMGSLLLMLLLIEFMLKIVEKRQQRIQFLR